MNREVIKKFKEEFKHWLDGGKIKCLVQNNINGDKEWINKNQIRWDNEWRLAQRELAYIIDDEYCKYRIAIYEGKTVQLGSLSNDTWITWKNPDWTADPKYYRVLSEETKELKKPLPHLEVDTKVFVWDCDTDTKSKRYFSHFNKNGIIHCFDNGTTSWSSPNGNTTEWNNWKLWK